MPAGSFAPGNVRDHSVDNSQGRRRQAYGQSRRICDGRDWQERSDRAAAVGAVQLAWHKPTVCGACGDLPYGQVVSFTAAPTADLSGLDATYTLAALELAQVSAAVSNYADHVEHNEHADRAWVLNSAATMRSLAAQLADAAGLNLLALYADRLRVIEERNVLSIDPQIGAWWMLAADAATWRELQALQARHDRDYHPDVHGLSKCDQLRHYAFHLAKLCGLASGLAHTGPRDADSGRLEARLIADTLLFAVKLPTVMGARLDDTPIGS
jgi:hypothetical protein